MLPGTRATARAKPHPEKDPRSAACGAHPVCYR